MASDPRRSRVTRIIFILFCGLALTSTVIAQRYSEERNDRRPEREPRTNEDLFLFPEVKQDLNQMIERVLTMPGIPQLNGSARESLLKAQARIQNLSEGTLSEEEYERFRMLAPQIDEMNRALLVLETVNDIQIDRREIMFENRTSSPPFPDAAYPNLITDVSDATNILAGSFVDSFASCCKVRVLINELSDLIGIDVAKALDVFTLGEFSNSCDEECPSSSDKPSKSTSQNTNSIGQFGNCDAINRSSTLEAYSTRVAFIVAEAARDVASRICSQEIGGAIVAGNLSVACIPMDLAFIVAKGLHDNLGLCDSFIDEAEINGVYERVGHLHFDMETAQFTVTNVDIALADHQAALGEHNTRILNKLGENETLILSSIGSGETQILNSLQAHDTEINSNIDTHDIQTNAALDLHNTEISAQILAHDTAVKAQLDDTRKFFILLEIEEALISRERDSVYYLPAANGGHLELVREIVSETISKVANSGESTNKASQLLSEADASIAKGNYKRAFDLLADSYFEAVRKKGENLPSPNSAK